MLWNDESWLVLWAGVTNVLPLSSPAKFLPIAFDFRMNYILYYVLVGYKDTVNTEKPDFFELKNHYKQNNANLIIMF